MQSCFKVTPKSVTWQVSTFFPVLEQIRLLAPSAPHHFVIVIPFFECLPSVVLPGISAAYGPSLEALFLVYAWQKEK